MSNLNKREIVMEIFKTSGFPQKQIVDTVQHFLDVMRQALAETRTVKLRNFGVLELQVRKPRVGRNPKRPETAIEVPLRAVVRFKSGKILKRQMTEFDLAKLPRSSGTGRHRPAPTQA